MERGRSSWDRPRTGLPQVCRACVAQAAADNPLSAALVAPVPWPYGSRGRRRRCERGEIRRPVAGSGMGGPIHSGSWVTGNRIPPMPVGLAGPVARQ
ncbi:hypothetical protein [Ornithinimicrobium kibberense]|uniref:hypothetical protein n=1 Tax=Ornithinimicrobium kibberense TaxID=282060 RepID=UPI00361B839B